MLRVLRVLVPGVSLTIAGLMVWRGHDAAQAKGHRPPIEAVQVRVVGETDEMGPPSPLPSPSDTADAEVLFPELSFPGSPEAHLVFLPSSKILSFDPHLLPGDPPPMDILPWPVQTAPEAPSPGSLPEQP